MTPAWLGGPVQYARCYCYFVNGNIDKLAITAVNGARCMFGAHTLRFERPAESSAKNRVWVGVCNSGRLQRARPSHNYYCLWLKGSYAGHVQNGNRCYRDVTILVALLNLLVSNLYL